MLAKQLSIFLENKCGRLTEVTKVMGNAGINFSALSIADNSDFGILRCIVSEPERAASVLRENGFTAKVTDVIGLSVPNTPGALAQVLENLSTKGIVIEYLYSFANGDTATIVLRPNDIETCVQLLQEKKVDLLSANDLYKL